MLFNPLYTCGSLIRTLTNGDDPDENAEFHQVLHYLIRLKRSSEKEIHFSILEIITFDPSIYAMYYSQFIVSNKKKDSVDV